MNTPGGDAGAVIERPRLTGRLDDRSGRTLTLVVGPAGSGKSTLLRQWISGHAPDESVWVDLTSDDVTELADALAGVAGCADPAATLLADGPGPIGDLLARCLADRGLADGPYRLVVDAGPVRLSAAQTALLDRIVGDDAPSIIVASRSEPSFTLGRFAGGRQLGIIDAADLAFDRGEIAAVARRRLGRDLAPDEIEDLHENWGGWVSPVLVTLAAPMLLGGDTTAVSTERARPLVDDFVLRAVIDPLDAPVRSLLFDVAGWDGIVPSVCDAVLERGDSRQVLETLRRELPFVERENVEGDVYRLDPHFAATLRREAQRVDPGRVDRVTEAASEYHRVRGARLDGLVVLAAADQWDRVIDGLGAIVRGPLDGQELRRARVLADTIPADAIRGHRTGPQMLAALELILGNVARADELLAEIRSRAVHGGGDSWRDRVFRYGALAVMGPWRPDPDPPIRHAEAALALLSQMPGGADPGLDDPPFAWTRTLVLVHGAQQLLRADRFGEAADWLEQGAELSRTSDQVNMRARAAGLQALLAAMTGDLTVAVEAARRSERFAETLPGRPVLTVAARTAQTIVALEQNRLDNAESYLAMLADPEFPHPLHTRVLIGILHARLQLARGELRSGLLACERLRSDSDGLVPPDLQAALTGVEVSLACRYGQLDYARRLIERCPAGPELPAAEALVATASDDGSALAGVLARWPSPDRLVGHIERALFEAWSADRVGDVGRRHDRLVHAARLADPSGFTRVFLDTAPQFESLVRAEHATDPGPELSRLVDRLTDTTGPSASETAPEFTSAEGAVVELLATHLSTATIAEHLGVSPNTIKSRQRSIYRKLEVHRRSEAVARLVELGVLSAP